MRKSWSLPSEQEFSFTDLDWLQCLLDSCSVTTRDRTLLLFWRAWFLWEDCVHGKGSASVCVSADFIRRYEQEILHASDPDTDCTGKISLFNAGPRRQQRIPRESVSWSPPPSGYRKVNTDASFVGTRGLHVRG